MVECICLFESPDYSSLLPLVYLRPVYDLRCGILTLREKAVLNYPGIHFSLFCRTYLEDVVKQQNPDIPVNQLSVNDYLFINGQIIVDNNFINQVSLDGEDTIYISGKLLAAVKLSGKNLKLIKPIFNDSFTLSNFRNLPQKSISVKSINYPWELVNQNGDQIISDFKLINWNNNGKMIRGNVYDGAILLNKSNIFIEEGAKIKPGVILDAESGPIFIGRNVWIYPNAVIEGPAYIGNNSRIKIGARIYGNTSIGPFSKVGGEVENSIIHSYSNKQHDGFLGHSYIGSWVNLGANTNNSDLKNNYGTVKLTVNGEEIDSGTLFVGLIMGDHSKSGINTMFNTGTIVGISSNIFGSGFPEKYIPSFSWGGAGSMTVYNLQKSIVTAKKVMKRRNVEMTPDDEALFQKVFELTEHERQQY
jgi:UDP-N-acetylglucosamine diphosphorylase/glucosamine-1-phosphate N-acetyltransferase